MADGALSIKLRCASWQQLATIYKRDLSQGIMFLKASTPPAVGTSVRIDLSLPSATVIALTGTVHSHINDPQRGAGVELKLAPIPASTVWLIESALASEHKRMATPYQGVPAFGSHQVSGMIPTISEIAEAAEVAAAEQDLIKALVSEAESLKKLNPFLVLGVGYEATDSEVRAAFGELTKRYHPDRFARYESSELRQVAAEIFILIRDAYRRLADATARATLLASLGKQPAAPRAVPGPPRQTQAIPPPRQTQKVPIGQLGSGATRMPTSPPPSTTSTPAATPATGSSTVGPAPGPPAATSPSAGAPAAIPPPPVAILPPAGAPPPPTAIPPIPGPRTSSIERGRTPSPPAEPAGPLRPDSLRSSTPPATQPAAEVKRPPAPPAPTPAPHAPPPDPRAPVRPQAGVPSTPPASVDPRVVAAKRAATEPGAVTPAAARRAATEPGAVSPGAARRAATEPGGPPTGEYVRRARSSPTPATEPVDVSALEELLDQSRVDEALAAYRLMAKKHPSDRNVRAGVEVCEGLRALAARDRLEAAQRFEAALEIDPSNERAARELAEMRRQATNERKGLLSRLMGKKEP
jgi:DnaJ-domain-containing protein 1